MDWIITILMALFSTTVGAIVAYKAVKWTIQAENEREANNRRAYKDRLVVLMITELDALSKFCADNQGIPGINADTAVEATALMETVPDQIRLLDNPQLLNRLYGLRLALQKLIFAVEYLRARPFRVGMQEDTVAQIIESNFSGNMRDLVDNHFKKDIRNLLMAELSPEEAAKHQEKAK